MLKQVAFVLLLAAAASAAKFEKCHMAPAPEKVDLSNQECVYTVGDTASVNVTFKARQASKSLTATLMGTVNAFSDAKACSSLKQGSCPLVADKEYLYEYPVAITEKLVGALDLVFSLHNELDQMVTCYRITCEVKAKK
ncbi:uncharacterized protein LOC134535272 [Bacillus rossius redtenbacheri]|uniref:uncharacterized protein LOC134535272 n=1 Tax=Bacillus rossius redtenbacheri TaxID=93214 RepID=UPI002FDD407C